MKQVCKCHGVSGSCQTRTCWMEISDLQTVGRFLKRSYRRAIEIASSSNAENNVVRKRDNRSNNNSHRFSRRMAAANNNNHVSELFSYWEAEGLLNSAVSTGRQALSWPESQLVYTDASPNYCHANETLGVDGTLYRTCSRAYQTRRKKKRQAAAQHAAIMRMTALRNVTTFDTHDDDGDEADDEDDEISMEERRSCKHLCRRCGYSIKKKRERVISRCNCKFVWCCRVECQACAQEVVSHVCSQ